MSRWPRCLGVPGEVQAHPVRAAVGRELERVAEQVAHDLVQEICVEVDPGGRASGSANVAPPRRACGRAAGRVRWSSQCEPGLRPRGRGPRPREGTQERQREQQERRQDAAASLVHEGWSPPGKARINREGPRKRTSLPRRKTSISSRGSGATTAVKRGPGRARPRARGDRSASRRRRWRRVPRWLGCLRRRAARLSVTRVAAAPPRAPPDARPDARPGTAVVWRPSPGRAALHRRSTRAAARPPRHLELRR